MLKELQELWASLPHKLVLAGLLAAWWALFEFFGAAQLHWLPTPSMFSFMGRMLWYAVQSENDDQLGVWMPLLFLGLVVLRRRELTLPRTVTSPWPGALIVIGAAAAHVVFFSVQQVVFSFLTFLVGVYGLTGVVWGREWLRRFVFPFVVLCFMVPIVHYLDAPTFWLRHFSAASATWIGQHILNIRLIRQATQVAAVDLQGNPVFKFDVVDACSGIRSLKVIILLTVVFGFLQFQKSWRRWILLLCAPFLAVAGNVFRLVATFWVGDLFGQTAASQFESKFGFVSFAVALGGLVFLARWLREPGDASATPPTPPTPTAAPNPAP